MKQRVNYLKGTPGNYICVGRSAFVIPVDHPDIRRISNNLPATTTTVVRYDESTGVFETLNTIYTPV